MRQDDLLDAMELIRDEYILSAAEGPSRKAAGRPAKALRRVFAPAAAAAALLLGGFTVALAASPDLRAAVVAFFRLATVENVPDPAAGPAQTEPKVTQTVIGDTIEAQYIQTAGAFNSLGDGLFCTFGLDETLGINWPAAFWTVDDGRAVPVDIVPDRREVSVDWRSERYQAVFDWVEWQGQAKVTAFLSRTGCTEDEGLELNMDVNAIRGRSDKVLLTLRYDTQMRESCWYMLYDLAGGQAEDFLSGTEASRFTPADRLHNALWAGDGSGVLLTSSRQDEGGRDTFWYLNLQTGTLTDLGAAAGAAPDGAVFADDRTVLLFDYGEGADTVSCRAYDLAAGIATVTLEPTLTFREDGGSPCGVLLQGDHTPYCMVVAQDGSARVTDLRSGANAEIQGFTFDPGGCVSASPDGTKLLYYARGTGENTGPAWSRLGVIDMTEGRFLAFDRALPAMAEESLFWLDDGWVAIECRDDSDQAEMQGLYLYEF